MPVTIRFENFNCTPQVKEIPDATDTSAGVMSPADKSKLDSLTPSSGYANGGTKTSDFNAVAGYAYNVDTSTGNVTPSLPSAAASAFQSIRFIKTVAANQLVLNDVVEGPGTYVSAQWTVWDVMSNGSVWVTV